MKTTGYSRISKDLIIREIETQIKQNPIFFITEHGGISATKLDQLRNKLRKAGARYLVVKKTLGERALRNAKLEAISETLSGAAGIAFTGGDPVASSKVLVEFAKENENFKIQSAYLNGSVVGVDQVKVLASLPSREALLAKVASGMQAPIFKLVNVLAGTLRQVVTVLDAIAKQKGKA